MRWVLSHACEVSCRVGAGRCPATVEGGFTPSRGVRLHAPAVEPVGPPLLPSMFSGGRPGRAGLGVARGGCVSRLCDGDRRRQGDPSRPGVSRPPSTVTEASASRKPGHDPHPRGSWPRSRSAELAPAVDVQRLTGDEGRLVAAQERGGGGDVLGLADPAHGGGLGVEPLQLLGLHLEPARGGVGHLGGDEAGRDRVGGDAERAELDAEGAGEALDAHLGGGVVGLAAVAQRGDAGEVEDLAVLLLHEPRLGGLGHVERRP